MSLAIENVSKSFGRYPALDGVGLAAAKGEFLALLGPSGSGKTTLLRVIAGLERPHEGHVSFGGEDFLKLTPRERRVGMVFQSYALFRHMTVEKNIAYGLKVRTASERPSKDEIRARVAKLVSLVQLDRLEKRFPAQLSGGQQQRVALARALAIEPRMLLLDEPFGALDAKVRKELRRQLRRIHEETGLTTIFVTHDQEEAMDLADRVVVLNAGRIEQIGTPAELAAAPASPFVFEFLGDTNRLRARIEGGRAFFDHSSAPVANGGAVGEVEALFRPFETDLAPEGENGLKVTVVHILAKGAHMRVECRGEDGVLFEVDLDRQNLPKDLEPGARMSLRPRRVFVFA